MKKFGTIMLFIFLSFSVYSQIFDRGNKGFNLGLGVDPFDMTPSAHFSGEVGVIPIANAGVISFGGGTDINFVAFDDVRTHLAFRAAFHAGFIQTDKFDIYAGLGPAVRLYDRNTNSYFYTEEFIGARMKLKDKIGLFLELGYGATYSKFGVTWIL